MSASPSNSPRRRPERALLGAFTFAGAILGVGLFGLAKVVLLLAHELNWITDVPAVGAAWGWLGGGAFCGLAFGLGLVSLGRRRQSQSSDHE